MKTNQKRKRKVNSLKRHAATGPWQPPGWAAKPHTTMLSRADGGEAAFKMAPTEEEELEQLRQLIGDDLDRLRPRHGFGELSAISGRPLPGTGTGRQRRQRPMPASSRPRSSQPWSQHTRQASSRPSQSQPWRQPRARTSARNWAPELTEFEERYLEGGWNSSVHRLTPGNLKGLRPIGGVSTREPWARDATFYHHSVVSKPSPLPAQAAMPFEKPDSSLGDMVVQAREAKKRSKELGAQHGGMKSSTTAFVGPGWNSSPLRHTPHTLRGSKPMTDEPWTRDERANRRPELNDAGHRGREDDAEKRRRKNKKPATPIDGRPAWDSSKTTFW
jgi:hypothetical protein